MKKVKRKKMRKSIGDAQPKCYCNFSCNEHVLFDEVLIWVKYRPKAVNTLNKTKWSKVFGPFFLLRSAAEIIKTMF